MSKISIRKVGYYLKLILESSEKGVRNDSPLITILGSIAVIYILFVTVLNSWVTGERVFLAKLLLAMIFSTLPFYLIWRAILLILKVIKEDKENKVSKDAKEDKK